MKTMHCRDLGFDCDQEIRAETEDEILRQAAAHTCSQHNVEVTVGLVTQVKTLIRDEKQ